jgi:hypothetical protein
VVVFRGARPDVLQLGDGKKEKGVRIPAAGDGQHVVTHKQKNKIIITMKQ